MGECAGGGEQKAFTILCICPDSWQMTWGGEEEEAGIWRRLNLFISVFLLEFHCSCSVPHGRLFWCCSGGGEKDYLNISVMYIT
jgi:hypothetical protein